MHTHTARVDPPQHRELLEQCIRMVLDHTETHAVREAAALFLVNATASPSMHRPGGRLGTSVHTYTGRGGGSSDINSSFRSVDIGRTLGSCARPNSGASFESFGGNHRGVRGKKGQDYKDALSTAKVEELGA